MTRGRVPQPPADPARSPRCGASDGRAVGGAVGCVHELRTPCAVRPRPRAGLGRARPRRRSEGDAGSGARRRRRRLRPLLARRASRLRHVPRLGDDRSHGAGPRRHQSHRGRQRRHHAAQSRAPGHCRADRHPHHSSPGPCGAGAGARPAHRPPDRGGPAPPSSRSRAIRRGGPGDPRLSRCDPRRRAGGGPGPAPAVLRRGRGRRQRWDRGPDRSPRRPGTRARHPG